MRTTCAAGAEGGERGATYRRGGSVWRGWDGGGSNMMKEGKDMAGEKERGGWSAKEREPGGADVVLVS